MRRRRGMRRYLFQVPIAVLVVAVLLSATLVGAKLLLDHRTAEQRRQTLPAMAGATAALTTLDPAATEPTASGVRTALAALVADPALGPGVLADVIDTATGDRLFDRNAAMPGVPASTAKVVTAAAALTALGPDSVFKTRVDLGATTAGVTTVVLVGGGDPTLAGIRYPPRDPDVARLSDLATGTITALRDRGVRTVQVTVDDGLFTGPQIGPAWKPNYVPDGDVSPVTALSVDAGRLQPDDNSRTPDVRAADPPLTAGHDFVTLLERGGLSVHGVVRRARPPAAAPVLASVSSPPVRTLVVRMLQRSDNDLAEALLRHVAVALHQPATFVGGASAERLVLPPLGIDPAGLHLVDGSGLSLADRVSPRVLTGLLTLAADSRHPELRPILEGLPVAGFSGTLALRYRLGTKKVTPGPGAGIVRAKTGTLTGVSALAGVVVDTDGRLLAFALVAPGVPAGGLLASQQALDRVAARLAACGCH